MKPKLLLLPVCLLVLSGFSKEKISINPEIAQERKAQELLPKSNDPMWELLKKTKIHNDYAKGLFSATFPDEVKALVGKPFTISGFMLPLEAKEKFRHFILSKRTPTCAFCPPGEPNEIVDVWMDEDVTWAEDTIKVSGTFSLMNNPELGLFFKLSKAKKL
jgi:hypothetical protein